MARLAHGVAPFSPLPASRIDHVLDKLQRLFTVRLRRLSLPAAGPAFEAARPRTKGGDGLPNADIVWHCSHSPRYRLSHRVRVRGRVAGWWSGGYGASCSCVGWGECGCWGVRPSPYRTGIL